MKVPVRNGERPLNTLGSKHTELGEPVRCLAELHHQGVSDLEELVGEIGILAPLDDGVDAFEPP